MDNMSLKQKEQLVYYALDIAGNKVPVHIDYIPTIKGVMTSEKTFEEFLKSNREPIKFETLTLPKNTNS